MGWGASCIFRRTPHARASAKLRTRATTAPRSSRRCRSVRSRKRDLFKWGIYTATGALALKNGLSPFAPSAFADDIPTGTPRSPLGTATKFSQPMPRLALQTPYPLTKNPTTGNAVWPAALGERDSKRLSWHTEFTAFNTSNPGYPNNNNPFRNPLTARGPIEGRPPGEVFAHQRWDEFFPQGRLCDELGPGRGGNEIPSRLDGRRIRTRSGPTAPGGSCAARCRRS